jgi:hypothetical protein
MPAQPPEDTAMDHTQDLKTASQQMMGAHPQRKRLNPAQRATLAAKMARAYKAGESIRKIAADVGRSYTWTNRTLREAGVPLRPRGSHRKPKPKADR